MNVNYRWDMRNDTFTQIAELARLAETITLYSGFSREELAANLEEKRKVLSWMVNNKVVGIDAAGFVVANYYKDKKKIMKIVEANAPYSHDVIEKGLA